MVFRIVPSSEELRHSRRRPQSTSFILRASSKKSVYSPPTVAETKARFAELHTTPIPAVYSTVVLELLVQQHFMRHNKKYKYDPIFALGFMSAFDQILEGFDPEAKEDILGAYLNSLDEDSALYKADAVKLESACKELEGGLDTLLSEEGNASNLLKKSLKSIAQNARNGEFFYSKFFAIGLFRVLELTGFTDPKALERLVDSIGLSLDFVNRDLKLYKTILTKLSAAREMVKEVADREKKKAAKRESTAAAAAAAKEEKTQTTTETEAAATTTEEESQTAEAEAEADVTETQA
eukprot:g4687.t1